MSEPHQPRQGILARLGWRQESRTPWAEELGKQQGKTASPDFVPDLIRKNVTSRAVLQHQAQVAEEDPIARNIVTNLSINTFDDWFELVDKDGNTHPINEEVQKQFRFLDAQFIYTQCLITMRKFGWCWQQVGKEKIDDGADTAGRRVANLDYFSPEEMIVVETDDMNRPKTLRLNIEGVKEPDQETFPVSDFVLWNSDPIGRSWKGFPACNGAWDALTELRLAINSVTWYIMKIGMGAWVIELKKSVSDTEAKKIENMIKKLNQRTVAMVSKDKVEGIDFKGAPISAASFVEIFNTLLGRVAAATGIPADVFTGQSAGKIMGSDVNLKSLYQVLNGIQTGVARPIRKNLDEMGFKNTDPEYFFKWNVKFVPDAEQEAKISFLKTEELGIRTSTGLFTKNELREFDGYPPLAEGGEELSTTVEIVQRGAEPSDEATKRENTENITGDRV